MGKIKPILFKSDMVRAILEGRKTVTRRLVRPQPRGHAALLTSNLLPETTEAGVGAVYAFEDGTVTSPPYRPGDILYVRETWQYMGSISDDSRIAGQHIYRADWSGEEPLAWRPSIHMPREAARIFLRVTGVRVERLRPMGLDDFEAEGLSTVSGLFDTTARFADLWDSTIKPADRALYGWEANPWVWVIEFERCEKPEGA